MIRERPTSRWSEAASWRGEGLRREVFYFRSGGVDLYGSLYAAVETTRPFGIVACNSWGVEADRCDPLQRSVAMEMARLGGAGMVFHYPGYGDSHGDLAGLDLDDLAGAAVDAVAEAGRRCPGIAWTLAGFMLGASVAAVAQPNTPAKRLLLVQPSLRPGGYFNQLANRRSLPPASPGGDAMEVGNTHGMAYGYPVPSRIVAQEKGADAAVAEALARFEGKGTVIRHEEPQEPSGLPRNFERIEVGGSWRFGAHSHPSLVEAAVGWLERGTAEGVR
jgi:hypothetical protein